MELKQKMYDAVIRELEVFDNRASKTKLGQIMWNRKRTEVVEKINKYFADDFKPENHAGGFEGAQAAVLLAEMIPPGFGNFIDQQNRKAMNR